MIPLGTKAPDPIRLKGLRGGLGVHGNTPWRRFAGTLLAASLLPALALYLFIVLVDPWGMLPVHLPIVREPISTNARFSFPALATDPRFDAVIVGTSTSRLLRPAVLDGPFRAHFANLAMNAATAWEQARMLSLFARTHRQARAAIVGLDASWCLAGPNAPHLTGRAFPAWMYGGPRAAGYLHMFNLYALQEAANQLWAALGFKRTHYGFDGYTDFLPPDAAYDRRKVEALFRRWGAVSDAPASTEPVLPDVLALPALLRRLPPQSAKILLFPPITIETMGRRGSAVRASWDACKRDAAIVAGTVPNTRVVDFAVDDAINRSHENFWDPIHYRVAVADTVMNTITEGIQGPPLPGIQGQRP